MLEGTLKFKPVIKKLTEDSDDDLREYELTKEEWEVLAEVRDTLKVRNRLPRVILAVTVRCTAAWVSSSALTLPIQLDFKGCDTVVFSVFCADTGQCNSCHGQD